MFNLLRMDLRRLFKSRNFKIVLLVTAALILMVSLLITMVSDPETLDAMGASGAELDEIDRQMSEEIRNMTQLDLAHETLGSGFLLERELHLSRWEMRPEGEIRIYEALDAKTVGQILAQAGIAVAEMGLHRQDLEDYFLERMGGNDHV